MARVVAFPAAVPEPVKKVPAAAPIPPLVEAFLLIPAREAQDAAPQAHQSRA
jgi:hypothetical protein